MRKSTGEVAGFITIVMGLVVAVFILAAAVACNPGGGGNTYYYPQDHYHGYYDTHHTGHKQTKPSPWKGSSNVVFVGKPDGSSGGWDTSAIRVDNLTSSSLTVSLTVDIGSKHFARWTSQSKRQLVGAIGRPQHRRLIVVRSPLVDDDRRARAARQRGIRT